MNIPQAELVLLMLGAIASGGWAVLHLVMRGLNQRHAETRAQISEQFKLAEEIRKEASEHWRMLFTEISSDTRRLTERIELLEARVTMVDMELQRMSRGAGSCPYVREEPVEKLMTPAL